jgi:hypothetical protein
MRKFMLIGFIILVASTGFNSNVRGEELRVDEGAQKNEEIRQSLDIERQKLELERQHLELDRKKLELERQQISADNKQTVAANTPLVEESRLSQGAQKHDGFFLRLAPGVGFGKATEEIGKYEYEWSGMTGHFNFAIGGAVTENFILQLDLSGVSASDPKYSVNGKEYEVTDTSVTTSLLGVGFTYYFPSSNIYFTGAVGQAQSTIKYKGTEYKMDKGYGFNVILGKEWWISDNWGLGLAAQYLYTKCPDSPAVNGVTPDVNATSYGLLLSATYN